MRFELGSTAGGDEEDLLVSPSRRAGVGRRISKRHWQSCSEDAGGESGCAATFPWGSVCCPGGSTPRRSFVPWRENPVQRPMLAFCYHESAFDERVYIARNRSSAVPAACCAHIAHPDGDVG